MTFGPGDDVEVEIVKHKCEPGKPNTSTWRPAKCLCVRGDLVTVEVDTPIGKEKRVIRIKKVRKPCSTS